MRKFFLALIDFFEWFDEIREKLEHAMINFAAGIIPYFSSLIPAWFVFIHLKDMLDVPWGLSAMFAIVVEVLGFASINTFVTLYQYRQKYSDKTTKGSVSPSFAVFSFAMYLLVIVLVNGVLGIVESVDLALLYENRTNTAYILQNLAEPLAVAFSVFILSLLTVPGAVVVVSRTQHSQFIQKHATKSSVAITGGSERKMDTQPSSFSVSKNHRKLIEYLKDNNDAFENISELSRIIGFSRPTLMKYRDELAKAGIIGLDGNKVVDIKE